MAVTDSNIIEKLISLGFTPRESKLYFALIRTGEATALELDQISGVPRTKTYETLGQMTQKGFCIERRQGGKKFYRAVKPSQVREMLRDSWSIEQQEWEISEHKRIENERKQLKKERLEKEVDIQGRNQKAEEVFGSLDGLFTNSIDSDPILEKVELIRSAQQTAVKWVKLVTECEKEMLSFTRSPSQSLDDMGFERVLSMHQEVFAKGVAVRCVYMDEQNNREWLRDAIVAMQEAGEEVRVAKRLPIKLCVFDRKTVMIALPSVPGLTSSDFLNIVIEDPGFIEACCRLFETYWSEAETLEDWIRRVFTD